MNAIQQKDLEILQNILNSSKEKRNGYIMIPTIEGFRMYEISEERLNLYIQAEEVHRCLMSKEKQQNVQ